LIANTLPTGEGFSFVLFTQDEMSKSNKQRKADKRLSKSIDKILARFPKEAQAYLQICLDLPAHIR